MRLDLSSLDDSSLLLLLLDELELLLLLEELKTRRRTVASLLLFLELRVPLVPHYKIVSFIQVHCPLIHFFLILFKQSKPLAGELFPPGSCLCPNLIEVAVVAEILCHSDGVIEVQDRMPPAARDKDALSRLLNTFNYR